MIVTMRDYNNGVGMLNAYADILGGAALLAGQNVFVLSLTNMPAKSPVKLLIGESSEVDALADRGTDALINLVINGGQLTADKIQSKSEYMSTGSHRFDVADSSLDSEFVKHIPEKRNYIAALLAELKSQYSFVIVILDNRTDDLLFRANDEEPDVVNNITKLFDKSIVTVRQGTWPYTAHDKRAKNTRPIQESDIVVVTDFIPESKFGLNQMRARLNIPKKTDMYKLSENAAFLDAMHSDGLLKFITDNGNSMDDFTAVGRDVMNDLHVILETLLAKKYTEIDPYNGFQKIATKTTKSVFSFFSKQQAASDENLQIRDIAKENYNKRHSVMQVRQTETPVETRATTYMSEQPVQQTAPVEQPAQIYQTIQHIPQPEQIMPAEPIQEPPKPAPVKRSLFGRSPKKEMPKMEAPRVEVPKMETSVRVESPVPQQTQQMPTLADMLNGANNQQPVTQPEPQKKVVRVVSRRKA